MTKKQKAALAVAALEKEYPDALCSLEEKEPYRLLIAVRLSAQCTDARVNLVTPVLFERFPTLESLAFADVAEVEEIVHPCGFFRAKANDIVSMSRMLIEKYDSKVPDTIEELVKLPSEIRCPQAGEQKKRAEKSSGPAGPELFFYSATEATKSDML